MKVLFVLSFLLGASAADVRARFEEWCAKFGKGDEIRDDERRFAIWTENDNMITAHNSRNDVSYSVAHNSFSHLTWDEFREHKRIGQPLQSQPNHPIFPETPAEDAGAVPAVEMRRALRGVTQSVADLPAEVDWAAKGAVTPVKNQGQCGSCWSFSTTGAMEGAYFLKTGNLVSFSEQELVDCDTYDSGCEGGLMDYAFHFIQRNGGLCREDEYSYTARESGVCSKCTVVPGTRVKTWVDVEPTMESLMAAVAERPVSVAIEADEMGFQFYAGGVLTATCGALLDHGVLVVGYGTAADGTKYWKVKNSWGGDWGMQGYILLERGKTSQEGGECGILDMASYPVLEDY